MVDAARLRPAGGGRSGQQLGAPLPAAPFLLAMGALAGLGHFNPVTALALSTVAAVAADLVWFQLGQRRGESVLGLLCRLSLEPDTCVRLTHQAFDRYGQNQSDLLQVHPRIEHGRPSAGRKFRHFGGPVHASRPGWIVLWAEFYLGVGWLFRQQLERALEILARFGLWMFVALATPIALWIAWKYVQRRLWLRRVKPERMSRETVRALLDDPNPPLIVDLRPLRTIRQAA